MRWSWPWSAPACWRGPWSVRARRTRALWPPVVNTQSTSTASSEPTTFMVSSKCEGKRHQGFFYCICSHKAKRHIGHISNVFCGRHCLGVEGKLVICKFGEELDSCCIKKRKKVCLPSTQAVLGDQEVNSFSSKSSNIDAYHSKVFVCISHVHVLSKMLLLVHQMFFPLPATRYIVITGDIVALSFLSGIH